MFCVGLYVLPLRELGNCCTLSLWILRLVVGLLPLCALDTTRGGPLLKPTLTVDLLYVAAFPSVFGRGPHPAQGWLSRILVPPPLMLWYTLVRGETSTRIRRACC